MRVHGWIYDIIDCINDKEYIGQTTRSVKKRFWEHLNDDYYISNAMNAHGVENFIVVILKECYSQEELDYWERHLIKYRDTMAPNGYNLTKGGAGAVGFNDESLIQMSMSRTGEKNHFFGKHHTKKSRTEMAKTHRGKKLLSTTCVKMATIRGGKTSYKNLYNEMLKRQLSYKGLAKLLGMSQSSVSAKMLGRCNFTAKDKAKLVAIFGLPIEYLLKRYDEQSAVASNRYETPYKNLLAEMKKRQLTYTALAKLLDLSQSSISTKMLGKCNFTAKDKARLEEIFGLSAEYLLARVD